MRARRKCFIKRRNGSRPGRNSPAQLRLAWRSCFSVLTKPRATLFRSGLLCLKECEGHPIERRRDTVLHALAHDHAVACVGFEPTSGEAIG